MFLKLRQLLHLETTEEALRNYADVLEQGEVLKSEVDIMAREYLSSTQGLKAWADTEKEPEAAALIKAQQEGLTGRYLTYLAEKRQAHDKLEAQRLSYVTRHPEFEKALYEMRVADFVDNTLRQYRGAALTLTECDILIKAITKAKVQYADNIVFNHLGQLLIVQRGPLDTNGPNLWVLPGGHVQSGEAFDVAARRELLEETGFEADDVYHVGHYDNEQVNIEYYCSMIDTDEQSPVVDAEETRSTAFVPLKDLYKYPTMYNIWDNVYEILGIEPAVVNIKKAIAEGLVKGILTETIEQFANDKIDSLIKGCGGGAKKKFKKVMDEWKSGTLHSGSKTGDKVTSQKQAIAIALSETGQSTEKGLDNEFEKARGGVYENTEENRKLGRVGQKYGESNQDKKVFTSAELDEKYNFKTGYDVAYLELDSFSKGTTTPYKKVSKLQGTYPNYVKNEYKRIMMDDYKWFAKTKDNKWQETADPYIQKGIDSEFEKGGEANGQSQEDNTGIREGIEKAAEEKLHGGDADGKTLEDIAEHHGVDLKEIKKQYEMGLEEEKEHTDDEEERGEIAKDHLWKDAQYYTKLKTVDKSITGHKFVRTIWPEDMSEFEKAKKLGHLVPKKVQIKGKNGQIHMAIRWVNPETGLPEQYAEGYSPGAKVEAATFEEAVEQIAGSNMKKSDKVRNLIDLGVYNYKLITLLTGETQPGWYFSRSDINVKDLPDQSKTILDEVRSQQAAGNDTPDERSANDLLRDGVTVDDLWNIYDKNLRRVIQGRHKFSLVYGTGGVGKSYTFDSLAEKFELREFSEEIQPSKDQYDYVRVAGGRITPTQVYATMYRHRDKLIVFDDCDSVLSTPEVQGFLKGGLDTGVRTQISNQSSKKIYNIEGDPESGTIPNTFSFKGRVIAITNLTAQQIDQAVKSRAMCVNLTMTIDETIERLSKIKDKIVIWNADKTEKVDVTQEARDYAFQLLTEYKQKLGNDINTRVYSNAVLIADEGFANEESKEEIRKEVVTGFNSVRGNFDAMIREIKHK
jgi:8-oxo-dGTP pyrophosphatase MutT (NUDIX family)